jgi:YgiT-type zinc finger domain-containing protein
MGGTARSGVGPQPARPCGDGTAEADAMECTICRHGEVSPGYALVALQRGGSIVIIKDVPADVCGDCGEYYLTDEITRQILSRAEAAVESGAEVTVQRFAA